MRVLVTGGTGYLGAFVVPALLAAGHRVTLLGRRSLPGAGFQPWTLAETAPRPPAADALVHLAFHHLPGAYRGGEGDDPEGFLRLNRDGSLALIAAARAAGMDRILLLSSRAVYGDGRRGAILHEDDDPAPDSLYGRMKLELEEAAFAGRGGMALRATGAYGRPPGGADHKWSGLFADYLAGRPIAPRIATEVHGSDLAAAVLLLLGGPSALGPFNASDLLLTATTLLSRVQDLTGCPHRPPARAAGSPPGVMDCGRLTARGWQPGGEARLDAFLTEEFGRLRRPPAGIA